jgi:hypothetical protein
MADRGVVNAAEVLAAAVVKKVPKLVLRDGPDLTEQRAVRSCEELVDALLASSPSGDGGPVVIFPDRTVEPYPTRSEEGVVWLMGTRWRLKFWSYGSGTETPLYRLVPLAPPAIQDGTREESGTDG